MQLLGDNEREVKHAHADITGEGIAGEAEFEELEIGTQTLVRITLTLEGQPQKLVPGLHAVHIHEKADCSGDFKCAGGHFDPGPAGDSDPDVNHPYHLGDLPNILIDKNGKGVLQCVSSRVTLSSGPLSILEGEGTSLMIHANTDPYRGGEHGSGISGGPRVACGVIKEAPLPSV
ncbi:MAG: superoxide dismutase family protein [Candidatus Blackburnbacteria bacterium]|nr:superoxide dismutase family protein [Candidatus Blackburnbacteria bacterium]